MPRLYALCLLTVCVALAAGCGGGDGHTSRAKPKAKARTTATTPKDTREVRSSAQLQALASAAVRAIRACAAKQPGGRTINARTGMRCDANGLRRTAPALAPDLDSGQLKVQLDPGGRGYLVEASNHDFTSSFYVSHPVTTPEVRGCQPEGSAGCSKAGRWTTAR